MKIKKYLEILEATIKAIKKSVSRSIQKCGGVRWERAGWRTREILLLKPIILNLSLQGQGPDIEVTV